MPTTVVAAVAISWVAVDCSSAESVTACAACAFALRRARDIGGGGGEAIGQFAMRRRFARHRPGRLAHFLDRLDDFGERPRDAIGDVFDAGDALLAGRHRVGDEVHLFLQRGDSLGNASRTLGAGFRQLTDFSGHDGKSVAGLAGSCRLDGGVQREQVRSARQVAR